MGGITAAGRNIGVAIAMDSGTQYTQLSREMQKIVLGIKKTQHKRYSFAATLGVLLVRLVTTSGVLVMLRGLVLGTGFCLLFLLFCYLD